MHSRDLREDILDAISQTKHTKTAFLDAEKIDQATAQALSSEPDLDDDQQPGISDPMAGEPHPPTGRGDSDGSLVLLTGAEGRKAVESDYDEENMKLQASRRSEFDVVQSISDASFMKIAAHMTLQRSVAAFALIVIDRQPPSGVDMAPQPEDRPTGGVSRDEYVATTAAVEPDPKEEAQPAGKTEGGWRQPREPPDPTRQSAGTPSVAPPYEDSIADSDFRAPDTPEPTSTPEQQAYGKSPAAGFFGAQPSQHSGPPAVAQGPSQGYFQNPFSPPSHYPYMHPYYQYSYPQPPPAFDTDPEMAAMKAQLEFYKKQEMQEKERETRIELETRIRREAAEEFSQRMSAMRRAEEEAKAQAEASRHESERVAREKLEYEMATAARRRAEIEAIKAAAREEAEREIQAKVAVVIQAEREKAAAEVRAFKEMKGKQDGAKKKSIGALLRRGASGKGEGEEET